MIKVADKPSMDPAQQKLRLAKKQWNKDVSAFIDDLIHYKKLVNGQPNKFFKEKSFIKDPIPADPATILGALAADFQELAQRGNAITAAQNEYSKTRRKKQVKPPPGPTPAAAAPEAAPAPGLTQQLATFEMKYELISEASTPISRFFTRLFNPTVGFGSGADLRRARMAMLNACADTYRKLGKFQVQVVKSSKTSVNDANKKLHEAWNDWTLVTRAYVIFKNSKSVDAPDKGGSIEKEITAQDLKEEKALESLNDSVKDFESSKKGKDIAIAPTDSAMDKIPDEPPPASRLDNIKIMIADYRKWRSHLPVANQGLSGYMLELSNAIDKFLSTGGKEIAPDFEEFYDGSILALNGELGTAGSSFEDIVNQLKTKVAPAPAPLAPGATPAKVTISSSSQIEKVAQDFLKKWVGKTVHQLSLFDKTSTHRLSSYNAAQEIRVELNQIMNLLEKDLNEEELDPLIRHANSQLTALRGMMRSLHLVAGK